MQDPLDPIAKVEIEKYEGLPNEKNPKEKSNWKKFLGFFLPWLSHKRELGERFLAAKVLKEEAEAISILADAHLKVQQAKKVAAEASQIEQEKLKSIDLGNISKQDIEMQVANIEDKIKYLSAVFGLKIESENSDLSDET